MSETSAQRFGANIKKIRLGKNMSQSDICRLLNFDPAYMSNIENGKQNLTLSTMEKLASALNVTIDQLLR